MKTIKNNLVKRALIFVGLVLLGMQVFAQDSFVVKGRIVKTDKQGVKSATVTLLDSKTLEVVAADVCDKNGVFVIENLKKGEYILSVSKPGFTKSETRFIQITDSGNMIDRTNLVLKKTPKKTSDLDAII
jgi:hypothetical protein